MRYELPGGNEDNDLYCERLGETPGKVLSEWDLSDVERKAIADGGKVWLIIHGEPILPVSLGVVAPIEAIDVEDSSVQIPEDRDRYYLNPGAGHDVDPADLPDVDADPPPRPEPPPDVDGGDHYG